jgi:2-oxoglutarate ferredoxin oxidoreductase subunit beta
MPNQRSSTCPAGRNTDKEGYPIRVAELLATLETPAFIARVSSHSPEETIHAKSVIRRAFEYQLEGRCFAFVEVLAICPTNWGLSPRESRVWLEQRMLPYYTLGIKKRPEDFAGGGHGNY